MFTLEKEKTKPVEIVFVIEYTQVCSTTKRGDVLAGVKVINRNAKIHWMDDLMFTFEDNSKDEKYKCGFYSKEEDACFSLYFLCG